MQHVRRILTDHLEKIIALLLGLTVLRLYWVVTTFDFINFDDPVYVTSNPVVLKGLTLEGVAWAFSTHTLGHWHPLTWISHMIDVSFFGQSAGAHHGMNVLLFSICAGLVFYLLRAYSFGIELAFLGGLFFALHPMRMESVAWVAERKDVLSFLFGLLAMLSYLHKKPMVFTLVLFCLSLLAKPTFVTLPALLVLHEIYVGGEKDLYRSFKKAAPYFLISMGSCVFAMYTQHLGGALKSMPFMDRCGYAMVSLFMYTKKMVWPDPTIIFYPREMPSLSFVALAVVLMAAVTVILFRLRIRQPLAWFGWLFFSVTAFPLSGFIPIGGQLYADRWTLLPHLGLLIVLLSFVVSIREHSSKLQVILALAVCSMALVTKDRLPHWKNSETVFREALRVSPRNFMAHTNLGVTLAEQGRFTEAHSHYEKAIQLNPTYVEALNNMGTAHARQFQYPEAIAYFEKALSIDPSFLPAADNLRLARALSSRAPL